MKLRPAILTIGFFTAIIAGICLSWDLDNVKAKVLSAVASAKHQVSTAKPLKAPNDRNWSALSESELREFAKYFGKLRSEGIVHQAAVLMLEETIVTDGYEAKPGEFVFTKITPATIRYPNSENPLLVLDVEKFSVDVVGGQQSIRKTSMEVPVNGLYNMGYQYEDRAYSIQFRARVYDTGHASSVELEMKIERTSE